MQLIRLEIRFFFWEFLNATGGGVCRPLSKRNRITYYIHINLYIVGDAVSFVAVKNSQQTQNEYLTLNNY